MFPPACSAAWHRKPPAQWPLLLKQYVPLSPADHAFPAILDIFLTVSPLEVKFMTKGLPTILPEKGGPPRQLSRNTLNYR